MSYGQQPGGYGQPDLQIGMPVSSDNGWTGTITEVIPAAPGYEGAVRVAWHGDGTTLVALSLFVVEQGQAVIRTQPPPPPQPPAPSAPVQTVPEDDLATRLSTPQQTVPEDDLATRLSSPARNDPSHVNPYVSDPPLVTNEPPPIRPTHGGQMHDDMTVLTPAPREESAGAVPPQDLEATYVPQGGPAPVARTYPEYQPYAPPAPPVPTEPDTGLTTPLDAMASARPDAMMMDPGQQEMTVPVVEEQVAVHPEWRDAGAVTVRTVMEEVPQTLTQETLREELFVERVAVGRELAVDEEVAPREEGDTYIIPVIVEEAVVVIRRVLAEELRITKRVIPTTQSMQAVVRKERVEIDSGDLADRVHEGDEPNAMQSMQMEKPT